MANLAKKYNNPLALIQRIPDEWKGLVGKTSGGFLMFSSFVYGARAGYINLVNGYLKRGLNTPSKITPVYAPKGHGGNDPAAYARLIASQMGITVNTRLKASDLFALGLAMARVELGYAPSVSLMRKGFDMAIERVGNEYLPKGDSDSSNEKKKSNLIVPIVAAALGIYFFRNITKKA